MKNLLLLLFIFSLCSLRAQNGFTTYNGTLPSGTVPGFENGIVIDNSGNKWIGFGGTGSSPVGIAYYNTTSNAWTFYNVVNTPSMVSDYIKCMTKDNAGNIWFGTSAGLIKFDGVNFISYTTSNGLPNNTINSIDSYNNMLYIGTSSGLSRFDGTIFTNYNPGNSLFPFNAVTSVKAENVNTIWAGSGNNLIRFTINSTFTSTSYTSTVLTNTTTIASIYVDGAGNKWISQSLSFTKYDNTNFNSFSSLYPNFTRAITPAPRSIVKGPNNGMMFTASFIQGMTNWYCLVELLASGDYKIYYAPAGMTFGSQLVSDGSGNTFVTIASISPTGTSTPKMYSFNKATYNPFGQGPGGGVNTDNFKYLDINRVTAGIMNRGDMWWDIGGTGSASYEVPNGNPPGYGTHSGFAAALWLGGLDGSGQLHTSAQTYRQTGSDFWPGPLDTISAVTDTSHVMQYDKIWKVSYNDINTFITQFNLGNVPLSYTPTPDILSWPAAGNGNNTRNMAPFVDVNGNGIYDPMVGGDYPQIKGDETLYYIFNDNFTSHGETNGLPLGVEVHAMAYAYACSAALAGHNELAYTTFYDYKIFNRTNTNYNNVFAGFWTDVDLGCFTDDYIGSDPNTNLGFCYNSKPTDGLTGCSGTNGYGNNPPAVGTTILKGPPAPVNDGIDNNNDGVIDEPGEQCLLNVFDYYNNNIGSFPPQTTNPSGKYQYYNILQGNWKDSTKFTCGGNGYGGTVPTKIVYPWTTYPGNPCASWSESSAGNLAGDRRYIASSGPFTLGAKQMIEVEYAYVWSVDSGAPSNINIASANKLITDVAKVRAFYAGTKPNCLLSINIGIKEEQEAFNQFTLYPNPGHYLVSVKSAHPIKSIIVTDVAGRSVMGMDHVNDTQAELNVEALASGVYFVQVSGQNWRNTSKLIKN